MFRCFSLTFFIPFFVFCQDINKTEWSQQCVNIDGGKPNRTYGGNNWYAGFSDHLPIFCEFESPQIFTMFYNVENLFDTIDDPIKNDNSFLPESAKKWNSIKYYRKLDNLERVFAAINNLEYPNIIGLCEVENKLVIEDLLKQPFFVDHTYSIIHQDSPDGRGIDCAILFDSKFKLITEEFIEIKIPGSSKPTRDIVYAKLQTESDTINVFVNHWPSRWGGTKETEHKRVFAANTLKEFIEKNINKSEKVIIMGDFNDYPFNESLQNTLLKLQKIKLINLMSNLDLGSYNYRGGWGWLDQIIISENLIKNAKQYGSFSEQWMMYYPESSLRCKRRTYCTNKKCYQHHGNCY